MTRPEMIEARLVTVPFGRLDRLDSSGAAGLHGLVAILTHAEEPALPAQPRFAGDAVAAILADTATAVDAAARKIVAAVTEAALPQPSVVAQADLPGGDIDGDQVSVTLTVARQHLRDGLATTILARPDGDMSDGSEAARLAMVLARRVGRPVRLRLSHAQALTLGPAAPAQTVMATLAALPDGRATLAGLTLTIDGGCGDGGAVAFARADAVMSAPCGPQHAQLMCSATPPAGPALPTAAEAARELALDALAARLGRDPFDLRLASVTPEAAGVLRAAAGSFGWDRRGDATPLDEDGRLLSGSGIALAGSALDAPIAACAEVVVDRDTGHAGLARLVLALPGDGNQAALAATAERALGFALFEEAPTDPVTGALIAPSLDAWRQANAFALPDIEWAPAPAGQARGDLIPSVESAVAAAVLCALARAAGIRPAHLPMTNDRILAAIQAAGAPADTPEGDPNGR